MKLYYKVQFSPDYISIVREDNREEVVGWQQDEWTENPTIVFSIANAILQAVRYPKTFNTLLNNP